MNGKAPAAGDSSSALITSAWFKGEQAAEATQGTAKVATQAQTTAGTDDATIVTPKKLRAGFAVSLAVNGYIAFPTWLGGLIIQWGMGTSGSGGGGSVTFPVTFPTAVLQFLINAGAGASSSSSPWAAVYSALNKSGGTFYEASGSAGVACPWIAIGY
ncbi:gp53-like domain-containing protein [Paraburkholderia guartelaensis]|uniref:gp53-like domain-containing protein n=1 Tax=Paraburkholderia guartelaensis TaxID=2546446 RepID=UPI002AB609EF|nr:hypothetical protein [Paraburkholderia guartelaensis]